MHYHINDWHDGKAPKECHGVNFLLQKLIADLNVGVPVVHCSAGVGRTGTLIGMAVMRMLISANQPISVFNEVRKLKEQRWGMIYTPSQYDYLYEFTEHEINKLQNGIFSA